MSFRIANVIGDSGRHAATRHGRKRQKKENEKQQTVHRRAPTHIQSHSRALTICIRRRDRCVVVERRCCGCRGRGDDPETDSDIMC